MVSTPVASFRSGSEAATPMVLVPRSRPINAPRTGQWLAASIRGRMAAGMARHNTALGVEAKLVFLTSPRLRGEVEIRNSEFRVRGILHERKSVKEPFTPTLSERALLVSAPRRAGRGGAAAPAVSGSRCEAGLAASGVLHGPNVGHVSTRWRRR